MAATEWAHDPPPPYYSSDPAEATDTCAASAQPEVDALRRQLQDLGLETRGRKAELQKRLRAAKKKQDAAAQRPKAVVDLSLEKWNGWSPSVPSASAVDTADLGLTDTKPPSSSSEKATPTQPFEYYLVLDVEATCVAAPTEGYKFDYPNEIIEFPVVVIDARTLQIAGKFREYVRPTVNPILSEFCTKLTGISQATVDAADTFPTVLARFESWMSSSQFGTYPFANAVFVCDGPWDITSFMRKQCEHSVINRPPFFYRFVDLRRLYVDFYARPRTNLSGMLSALGMRFEGREHSGLDDATNIARIVVLMMKDGCLFVWNRECTLTRRMITRKGSVIYGKATDVRPMWNAGNSILF
ncbi:3'-5' exoribonuclease 1 [Geranomyces variabilis]|uniref:3'-5' exoribonuclease 1 n=1 Tax=Geranomyces variabilis TaxID=109894 RepID=A0AAD5TET4_9FUNG|nr:3'-5' exoribonuclease 1 [Geranomyces variabilis]